MKRRQFILASWMAFGATATGALAQAVPVPKRVDHLLPGREGTRATKVFRIGWPSAIEAKAAAAFIAAFEGGLREHGYTVGKDLVIDFRYSGPLPEDVTAATRSLVRDKADVIVTGTNPATRAARAAAQSVPIVFAIGIDVVGQGFAQSFAAPGGNLTGLTWNVGDLSFNKRLELLKVAAPKISRVAVLYDPGLETGFRGPLEQTAKALGLSLLWIRISEDFKRNFEEIARGRVEAIYSISGATQFARRTELIALANANRLPTIYGTSEFVEAGGLMSYGPNIPDLYRRAASYVDRILKGAKPTDLPIEQPMRLDLEINLKTARLIGLSVPRELLVRADRVIE